MTESFLDKFKTIFLRLMAEKKPGSYTRENWVKARSNDTDERLKLIEEEGREDLRGKEYLPGGVKGTYENFLRVDPTRLDRIVQFFGVKKLALREEEVSYHPELNKVVSDSVSQLEAAEGPLSKETRRGQEWKEDVRTAIISSFIDWNNEADTKGV